jgi:hypothetical protein
MLSYIHVCEQRCQTETELPTISASGQHSRRVHFYPTRLPSNKACHRFLHVVPFGLPWDSHISDVVYVQPAFATSQDGTPTVFTVPLQLVERVFRIHGGGHHRYLHYIRLCLKGSRRDEPLYLCSGSKGQTFLSHRQKRRQQGVRDAT